MPGLLLTHRTHLSSDRKQGGEDATLSAAAERGVTVAQVRSAVALCRRTGIQTGMFLMWGYGGEEISDGDATIDHVKQCRPDIFFTTVSYPIKVSPYFNKVADRLVTLC